MAARTLLVLVATVVALCAGQTVCNTGTAVACCWKMPSGNTYDLSSAYTGNEYRFSDGTNDYYWAPCHIPADCLNSAPICQHTTTDTTFALGITTGSMVTELSPPGSGITISYPPNAATPKNQRQAVLTLVCDPTQDPGAIGGAVSENPTLTYQLSFKSKYACPGTAPTPGTDGGFDMGWVFVIIVLVGAFVYVVGGVALNHFYFGAELGVSAIPQWGFWSDVPSLMKDGAMYVYHKITGKDTSHYQQI